MGRHHCVWSARRTGASCVRSVVQQTGVRWGIATIEVSGGSAIEASGATVIEVSLARMRRLRRRLSSRAQHSDRLATGCCELQALTAASQIVGRCRPPFAAHSAALPRPSWCAHRSHPRHNR